MHPDIGDADMNESSKPANPPLKIKSEAELNMNGDSKQH